MSNFGAAERRIHPHDGVDHAMFIITKRIRLRARQIRDEQHFVLIRS